MATTEEPTIVAEPVVEVPVPEPTEDPEAKAVKTKKAKEPKAKKPKEPKAKKPRTPPAHPPYEEVLFRSFCHFRFRF